ncbi:MAG: T9SS type A sorting domain-containing protein [Chitinophagales bacterium]
MKYLILLLFAFLSNFLSLQADNWELFPLNQKTYFYFETDMEKTISPYYVDFEEESGTYVRQYPLRNMIEAATGGCYEDINFDNVYDFEDREVAYNPHILKQDAYFRYVFQKNSSTRVVPFYPQTNVGESWEIEGTVFSERPYSRLKITCTSKEFSPIFSVMDSVRTFEIEAFDGENPIEAVIESFSFKISKKYGLVEWFDFRAWAFFDPTTKITLAGFEDENGEMIGEAMPIVGDFYPYSAGNVLKWKEVTYVDGQYPNIYHTDTIVSVVKTDTDISYTYNRNSTIEFSDNTVYETKQNEELTLNFFPQHFIDLHYWNLGMTDWGTYQTLNLNRLEGVNGKVEYTLTNLQDATFFNNCYVSILIDFVTTKNTFSTKVGVKEELEYGGFIGGNYSIRLQEAFIGDDYFTPIEENAVPDLKLSLSPNPTQYYLTIQTNISSNTPIYLQIFDLQGKSVLQTQFVGQIEVNTNDFSKGVYFVQASNGKNRWTEKVVKY